MDDSSFRFFSLFDNVRFGDGGRASRSKIVFVNDNDYRLK